MAANAFVSNLLGRRKNLNRASIRVAIVLGGFGINQVVRLVLSVILTHILAPQLMGAMVIINTLRTGVELLSDIGVSANIIRHPEGRSEDFLRTAWTVQFLRGLLLSGIFLAASPFVASFYKNPELFPLLIYSSSLFAITGLRWTAVDVLQKDQRVLERITLDVATNILGSFITIFIAWWFQSTFGLVLSLIVMEIVFTLASFLIPIGVKPKFQLSPQYVREMVSFGKWIFLGSALYFCAMSFDKIYLSSTLTLFALGVYNVGRTLSEAAGQAIIRLGEYIIFPAIAAFRGHQDELIERLRKARRQMLIPAALGLSAITALSPLLVLQLYDARYHPAALVAPMLLVAVWPTLLSIVSEMILRGLGRAAPGAFGNGMKLTTLLIGLPLGFLTGGMSGALIALIAAEWLRYGVMEVSSLRAGVSFLKEDASLTILFIVSAIIFFFIMNFSILHLDYATFEEWGYSLYKSGSH